MWPSVRAGKAFVGVASRGKTLGYLVPLVNCILTSEDTTSSGYPYPVSDGSNGEAPLAIVVCPTWKKAVQVAEILQIVTESE